MTEQDWLEATDPQPMLDFLRTTGKLSDRKARLFAVACCRRIWPLLTDERSRRAVEVAERYADGLATEDEMSAAEAAAQAVRDAALAHRRSASWLTPEYPINAAKAACWVVCTSDTDPAEVATVTKAACFLAALGSGGKSIEVEQAGQCQLVRCIFPNLLRSPPVIDPAVLAWNNGAVVRLARDIYEANAWDRLPELGRLLEQAGCTDQDILGHCREQGRVHVRGCWVADGVLGKE